MNSNIPQLYLKLLLLGKQFVCGLCRLDPVSNKHNNNLNVVQEVSLAELDSLETLENSLVHTVSSIVVSQEEQLNEVVNLLCDYVTPLLSTHDNVITNLALVIASASGVASTRVPTANNNTNNDNDSNGSTNTDFVGSINTLVMSQLTIFWKAWQEN